MKWYWLLLSVLAAWRITHLLAEEDGPFNLILRVRVMAGHGQLGKLLDCFYCLSLWVATPFAIFFGGDAKEVGLLIFSISGGAILLERMTARNPAPAPSFFDLGGTNDGLLRTGERRVESAIPDEDTIHQ